LAPPEFFALPGCIGQATALFLSNQGELEQLKPPKIIVDARISF